MKQIIPFTKDITFKNKVEEITSISLDHDLQLKGEDLITGNFYLKGKFKMTKASTIEEDFSYKIPCEVAISDDYDTFDAVIDIDDFYYDLLDDEILKINIALIINNLKKKEKEIVEEVKETFEPVEEDIRIEINNDISEKKAIDEVNNLIIDYDKSNDLVNPLNVITETKKDLFNNSNDTYSTYYVYLVKEGDSYESLTNKYKVKKEDIILYNNDVTALTEGIKLIIPEAKNE